MHDTGGNAAVRDVAKRLRKDGLMPKAEGRRTRRKFHFILLPSYFILSPTGRSWSPARSAFATC